MSQLFAKLAHYVAVNLTEDCTLILRQETQVFLLYHLFNFIISSRPSWKKPRDIIAWQIQLLVKKFGICMVVVFQAEDLNG